MLYASLPCVYVYVGAGVTPQTITIVSLQATGRQGSPAATQVPPSAEDGGRRLDTPT